MEAQPKLKNPVVREVTEIMNCLENENVKGKQFMRLNVWHLIFKRLLYADGKMILYSHNKFCANTKNKAIEALGHPLEHPILESARSILDFIQQLELGEINPADLVVQHQV
jgi:hypothetical protein